MQRYEKNSNQTRIYANKLPKELNSRPKSCTTHTFSFILCPKLITYYNKSNLNMKRYGGIWAIVLGTLILVLSYLLDWVDYNWVQGIALLFIICGLVGHIILSRKAAE